MIEENAYSNLAYDAAVIIACSAVMMVVGLFKAQIGNMRMRQLVMHGSLVAATSATVLMVIVPWLLGVAGYDTEWLHPLLVLGGLAAGLLVWGLLYRWMLFVEQSVDDEDDKARQARQKYVDQMGLMLDEKKAEIGSEVQGRLDAHRADVNQKLEDASKGMTDAVSGKLGQMDTKIGDALKEVDSKVKGMKDTAEASTAKVNELKGEVSKNAAELKGSVGAMKDKIDRIQNVPSEVVTIKNQIKDINISIGAIADSLLSDEDHGGKGLQHSRTAAAPGGQAPATTDQLIGNICGKLEKHGFRCVPGQTRSKPDIIIYDRDDGLVAPALVRPRKIIDGGENMTRRITRKMCPVGLRFAEEYGVSLAVIVVNTANGRMWISIVQHENINDWKGVTTPEILSKSDEVSGKALEREYRDAIIRLGGIV